MTAATINPAAGSRRETYLVEETTTNVVPTAATWDVVRNTGGGGLSQTIETTNSEELTGAVLGVRDVIETTRSNEFSYSTEFPMDGVGTPYYIMLESLVGDRWGAREANTIINGNVDVTFSLEDSFTDIATHQAASGVRCTSLELAITNNSIATATWNGLGTTFLRPSTKDVQAGSSAGVDDVSYVAATSTITVNAGVPANVDVGENIGITNATTPANNGYYKITAISGNDVTVDGILTDDASDTTALLRFSGDGQVETTGGTVNPTGTNTSAKAGDYIQVDLDGNDTLIYGLRFTSATINLERTSEQLYEITLNDPFTTIATDFTASVAFEWHLINDQLLYLLDLQSDHNLTIVVEDKDANSLTFTFPRVKFSEGAFGEASRGESMTGTATATAILDATDVMVKITHS